MTLTTMPTARMSAPHGGALKLHREQDFGEVSIAPPLPQSLENMAVPGNGTSIAFNNYTSGGVAYFPRNMGRGGARNSAGRESYELSVAQVGNLTSAARHADAIGLPLNRIITIHWEAAGVALEDMAKATGRFTDLMAKALARHGSRTAWLWVHENGDGKGGHCHMLAHVPAGLVSIMVKRQMGWLRRITGRPYRVRVIRSDPIGRRLGLEIRNPALHAENLDVLVSYVLKGTNEEVALDFGLKRFEHGGYIIGKRCGTSQNIGAKARKQDAE